MPLTFEKTEPYYFRGAFGELLAQYAVSGQNHTLQYHNINTPSGEPLGRLDADTETRYYYLKDHLGSVRVTIDDDGDIVGYDDYFPFGMQMSGRSNNAGNTDDDMKFTGYELEQEGDLNVYFAGARLYDPEVGRFYGTDAYYDKYPSLSPYQYEALNPLLFVDVNGDSIWVSQSQDGLTVHMTAKIMNLSSESFNMDELIDNLTEEISNTFSGSVIVNDEVENLSFDINIQVAESMDDVGSSDHLIVLADATGNYQGFVSMIGGKVAHLNAAQLSSGDFKTAVHEMGHLMGLEHTRFRPINVMRTGFTPFYFSNRSQRSEIIQNYKRSRLNRGRNYELRHGQFKWPYSRWHNRDGRSGNKRDLGIRYAQ